MRGSVRFDEDARGEEAVCNKVNVTPYPEYIKFLVRSGDVELSAAGAYKVLPGLLQHTFFALGHSLKVLFGWNDLICFIDRLIVKFFIPKKNIGLM